ncbi:MAG TPA: membrane protein insertase YidC [Pseudomonadales bacterium]
MLPTEVQRILLLIGLAATGYLLILAWNDDYVQVDQAPAIGAEPEVGLPDAPDVPTGEVPEEPGRPATPSASDVPDEALLDDAPAAAAGGEGPASGPAARERLIKVTTDTLEMWIDRVGGDIVRVQLPQHRLAQDSDQPFLLLNYDQNHVYVAQSGLMGADALDSGPEGRLEYRSEASSYTLTGDEPLVVELTAERDDVRVTKRFRFEPGEYLVEVSHRLENQSSEPLTVRQFAQIKRDDKEPYGEKPIALGPRPYLGAALTTDESRYEKLSFDDMAEEPFRGTVHGGWIAFLQHYFLSAWIAEPDERNSYFGYRRPDGLYVAGYSSPPKTVPAGESVEWTTRFYAGPKDQERLAEIAPNLNLTVDYGFLWWLAVPLFKILEWIHSLVGNWGVAIVLLTVLVKLILYPLSSASYRSMANMRRIAPQMKRLQERYADDRQKLSQEMMALYRKEKVNPLGGCLPMLLPMPIFLALYWVLFESVELRHAPFMLWIDDLSAMDPYFVLPLLMGASMYVMQLMSPAVGDPMQQRMMRLMPIMFTVLFLFFPAGLVLYWLVNNVLSMAQQWFVMRQTEGAQAGKA